MSVNPLSKIVKTTIGRLIIGIALTIFWPYAVSAERYILYAQDSPPLSIKHNNMLTGISVEMVQELFSQAGFDYAIHIVPLARAISNVKPTRYSRVFPLQRAQDREASFHWISPLIITRQGLYSRHGNPIVLTTLEDAKIYKIGAYFGSGVSDYLKSRGFTISNAARRNLNIKKLNRGRIDLWATDTISVNYYAEQTNLPVPSEALVFRTTLSALACNLSIPLSEIKKLQHTLDSMINDGFFARLLEKYK